MMEQDGKQGKINKYFSFIFFQLSKSEFYSYCPPPCQAGNNFAISNVEPNNPINYEHYVPSAYTGTSMKNQCPRNTYLDRFGRCVWGFYG